LGQNGQDGEGSSLSNGVMLPAVIGGVVCFCCLLLVVFVAFSWRRGEVPHAHDRPMARLKRGASRLVHRQAADRNTLGGAGASGGSALDLHRNISPKGDVPYGVALSMTGSSSSQFSTSLLVGEPCLAYSSERRGYAKATVVEISNGGMRLKVAFDETGKAEWVSSDMARPYTPSTIERTNAEAASAAGKNESTAALTSSSGAAAKPRPTPPPKPKHLTAED
jgi:hypothetical protein